MLTIDSLAVIAAAAAFVVSSPWYSPLLFGKVWMALHSIDGADNAAGFWQQTECEKEN